MKHMPLLLLFFMYACGTNSSDISPVSSEFQSEMLFQVNDLRASGCTCGNQEMPPVEPLKWNDQLEQAAARHVLDMNTHDFLEHEGTDGTTVADRVDDTGYNWSAVGENIAWGYNTIGEAMDAWIASPSHCVLLMNAELTEMGAAQEGTYWAQTFANPAN